MKTREELLDLYGDERDDGDSCGPECCGVRRHRYCSDRSCGAGDCSTCYGEGVDHDGCPEPEAEPECPECGDSGRIDCECDCSGCDTCHGLRTVPCPYCGGDDE